MPSERRQRALVLLLAAGTLACASAGREGEEIHIAEESALIIWDAASKTQHFIRRASFETRARDFGFLVPTPTAPKLAEADDKVFAELAQMTTLRGPPEAAKAVAKSEAPKSEVVVLERVKVAGLDAAVLAATDPGALDAWLKANGYASTPELMAWAAHYLEKRWIITAFKIASGQPATKLDASAVRMSFQTEQPYFPYREPAAAKGATAAPRLLRVYFLGDARMEGKLGADAWPGRATWSNVLESSELEKVLEPLKLPDPLPAGIVRLTAFSDASSPRPGREDLVFSAAAEQSAYPDPNSTNSVEKMLADGRTRQIRNERIAKIVAMVLFLLGALGVFLYMRKRGK